VDREKLEDGTELLFDHGAQYMTASYASVQSFVDRWQVAGLLDIWHAKSGSYNMIEREFSEETVSTFW
jgi:renalase